MYLIYVKSLFFRENGKCGKTWSADGEKGRPIVSFGHFSLRYLAVLQVDVIETRIDRRCSALRLVGDTISGISPVDVEVTFYLSATRYKYITTIKSKIYNIEFYILLSN